jgi:hypothetical protein
MVACGRLRQQDLQGMNVVTGFAKTDGACDPSYGTDSCSFNG